MKNNQLVQNFVNFLKSFVLVFIIFSFLSTCILSGCMKISKENYEKSTSITSTFLSTKTLSPSLTPFLITVRPTSFAVTPTRTVNPEVGIVSFVNVTQVPPIISSKDPGNAEFLYKDAFVTIKLVDVFNAVAYINLDDLYDNGMNNSDIAIYRTEGNEINYSLHSINYAYYSWSNKNPPDFDSCLQRFPIRGIDPVTYSLQGKGFPNYAGYFCVLTNENRIAIINYINGSQKKFDNGSEELLFKVTVFKEIINNQ